MTQKSRRVSIFIIFFVILFGGYFTLRLFRSSASVPPEFEEARLQGALISQNIVQLSSRTGQDIQKISDLNQTKDFVAALALSAQAVVQSRQIREQAVLLATEMEKMTKAVSSINSFEARQAALEAVGGRLSLISHLIVYSTHLDELLGLLQERFRGASGGQEISDLIGQINLEVAAVNDLNKRASDAMERFDAITK